MSNGCLCRRLSVGSATTREREISAKPRDPLPLPVLPLALDGVMDTPKRKRGEVDLNTLWLSAWTFRPRDEIGRKLLSSPL